MDEMQVEQPSCTSMRKQESQDDFLLEDSTFYLRLYHPIPEWNSMNVHAVIGRENIYLGSFGKE